MEQETHEIVSEDKIPDEIAAEDKTSGEIVAEDKIPSDIATEEKTPDEIVAEDKIPDKIVLEDKIPGEFVAEETIPGEIVADDKIQDDSCQQNSPPLPLRPSAFVPVTSGFMLPCPYSDIAMLSDGHLLLATGENGLVECDEKGNVVSRWKKKSLKRAPSVHTIAVLSEGRVAVGLSFPTTIVILQRQAADDGSWLVLGRFSKLLKAPPWRMMVHQDLIGVVEWSSVGGLTCSKNLAVLSVNAGNSLNEVYRRERNYSVYSLAITDTVLITSSNLAVKLDIGLKAVVIEAYTHANDHLVWRHVAKVGEVVYDILHIVSKDVLIMITKGIEDDGTVAAIRLTDGSSQPEDVAVVISHNKRIKKPWKLAVALVADQTVLAVLNDDGSFILCKEQAD